MKTAIIGGGAMGEAILSSALAREVFEPTDVVVCELVPGRREQLESAYSVETTGEPDVAVDGADVVLVALKPQDFASFAARPSPSALIISIMAGVSIAMICERLGSERIVRVMPNTPAAIQQGMSVWTATEAVTPEQREFTSHLLSAIGQELYVADEAKIDMATAIHGSGPGYVFLLMEALVDGGVAVGMPRTQAEQLVLQTFAGSALYAQQSDRGLAELKAQVTSPAGTTAAGLIELERAGVRAALIDAVRAAHHRARELGGNV